MTSETIAAIFAVVELVLVAWVVQSTARRGLIGTWERLKAPIRAGLERVTHGPTPLPGVDYDAIAAAEREIYGQVLTRPPESR